MVERLNNLQKIALIFDATPDSDSSSGRDLDQDATATEKNLHNLACFFAEDQDCWDKFINYINLLRK